MINRRSIAFEFMIIILVVLLVGQGVLGVWFLLYQKESIRKTHEIKARMEAQFLSEYASGFIAGESRESLDRFIVKLKKDQDIIAFLIRKSDGQIALKDEFGEAPEINAFNPFYVPSRNQVREPILSQGAVIGEVEVQYSGAEINAAMKRLLTVFPAFQVVVFLCAILLIYALFRFKVGKPLDNLGRQIGRITEGDLTVVVPQDFEGEIAVVAKGIQVLVDRLSYTVLRLASTSEKVSRTSRQVMSATRALAETVRRQSESTEAIMLLVKGATETQRQLIGIMEDMTQFSTENVSSLLEIKAMGDEMVSGMDALVRASEVSFSNVAQMSQTAKMMASNAKETLSSVEDISSSVEEVTASIRDVEKNARNSTKLAETVRSEAAKQGVEGVALAIDGMAKISDIVSRTVDQVQKLHESSKDIQRILSVIREITEQTNLLSLNASILAEKAGDHGKGFSVVAEEMRSLSSRTATYTKEISGIIKSIQGGIEDTVDMIRHSMNMVQKQSDNVYAVGETMSEILESAYNSSIMAQTIERATVEQVKSLHLVANSMVDVNSMALQMKKAMDEQLIATGHMLGHVGDVRDIAGTTMKGVNEQDFGIKSITKNMELASEKIDHVKNFILNQQKINGEIISSIGDIHSIGGRNLKDIEMLSGALENLQRDINQISTDMSVFTNR